MVEGKRPHEFMALWPENIRFQRDLLPSGENCFSFRRKIFFLAKTKTVLPETVTVSTELL
jgi:hypothetical protein